MGCERDLVHLDASLLQFGDDTARSNPLLANNHLGNALQCRVGGLSKDDATSFTRGEESGLRIKCSRA